MKRSQALRRTFRQTISLMIGMAMLSTLGMAQDFRATLTGRVMDASKAAIAGAQVRVKNIGTNEVTSVATDEGGNYKVPFLNPGTYSITVEVTGFKKFVNEGIALNISQVATIDIALEPGNISEQVTVTAQAPLIEAATADRGGVIDRQRVVELPLNARNPFMLGMLTAGVNFNGAAIWQRPFDNGAIADWTINGSQTRGNEFLLDGAPNNSQAGGNNIAYVPPVDSVQEFKIMTNTYDSQYGKTTGGIINVSLKSGGNALHGSVYEFARRNSWDANDFRNKARGRRPDGSEFAPRVGHYLDQYGFQVDGPVWIPKLYNGRNKTFFMVNYEGYREGVPSPLSLNVPEPEMLRGDFSKLVDASGQRIVIYDPATGRSCPASTDCPNGWRRDPFPGNIIPANRINPIAAKILSFMPAPNTSRPDLGYARGNLFVSPSIAGDDFYNVVVKIDQQIGNNHRMFVRYAANDRTEDRNVNGVLNSPGQDGQQPFKRINDAFVVDHVATFSPTFILNLRASFARFVERGNGAANVGFDKTTLGFPADLISQIPGGHFFGRYEFADYNSLGRHSSFNATNTLAFHPSVTKIRGSHTVRGGVDMRWIQFGEQNMGNPFRLNADRGFTRRVFNTGDALSGDSIASFLLGNLSGGAVDYNVFPITLNKYYAPWIQDDWKVNPRLTLNIGLRYDVNVAPNERFNRMNRGFDASVVNPINALIDRTRFPNYPDVKGGLLFAGLDGVPRIASDTDWNNFQPRLGFAYLLKQKTVIRGGWGIYYVNPGNEYRQFSGFSQSTGVINSLDQGRTPIVPNLINNPFPGGVEVPVGSSRGLETFLGRGFSFVGDGFKVPYVHQFSFGFQRELPWDSKIEISYVGSRTIDLQTNRPFNEPDLALRQRCNLLEGGTPAFCDERLPNPFQGIEAFRGTNHFSQTTLTRFDLSRPLPHFGGLTQQTRNDGKIWYNSLQVTYEKRASKGLNVTATYTLSKQIERWGFNDVQKNIMQQGLYLWDRPQRFTLASVYQLPFGEGQKLGNTSNGILKRIVSGWQNTVILQWQSGRPWDLGGNYVAVREASLDNVDWKAHQVFGVTNYKNPTTGRSHACNARVVDSGSNIGAIELMPYSQNLPGCTLANYNFLKLPRFAPRMTPFRDGRVRLHAIPIADVSLNKMTRITEGTRLQFRIEAFNVTNSYQFGNRQFINNIDDANFGSMFPRDAGNTETTYPRHVQLAVKFIF
jgi:hypothetical protein